MLEKKPLDLSKILALKYEIIRTINVSYYFWLFGFIYFNYFEVKKTL